jgi:hypothetical protein
LFIVTESFVLLPKNGWFGFNPVDFQLHIRYDMNTDGRFLLELGEQVHAAIT